MQQHGHGPKEYYAKWNDSGRERQTLYDFTYVNFTYVDFTYVKSKKKTYKQAKQTRNRLIDIENNLAVTRGRDVEQK